MDIKRFLVNLNVNHFLVDTLYAILVKSQENVDFENQISSVPRFDVKQFFVTRDRCQSRAPVDSHNGKKLGANFYIVNARGFNYV